MEKDFLIDIRRVEKSFGGLRAISNVEFEVKQGEILGLIGPNGAGKTTMFNLISGYCEPDKGEILFRGENICGLRTHKICKKGITRTFQIVRLFGRLSVFDNIKVGTYNTTKDPKEADQKTLKTLEFMKLGPKSNVLAKELTLADLKRVELGAALATEPKLLLLDETMAGLTPKETQDIMQVVKKINQEGVTLIIIEHVMQAVMSLSNRIVVLDHGEKIAEGSPAEISRNEKVIQSYLGKGRSIA